MSPLPFERISIGDRAYTVVGVDFFGPEFVSVRFGQSTGRKKVKRGHSTRQIWSDNATNFVGADNEISRAVQEIDERKIVNFLSRHGVELKYSPARSPHQSGQWEVMIRETKDTNLARNQWSRARVRKVFPD